MRKKKLIPTKFFYHEKKEPVVIKPLRNYRFRKLKLWGYLIYWAFQMIWLKINPKAHALDRGIATRELFEKLGFLWIKVGQFLSLRVDIFSRTFCQELSKLQHRAYGFPPDVSRQVIEEQLGGPIERFFVDFEDHPIAAASIAQVHKARLKKEQEDVIIKVMRTGASDIFVEDMKFISLLFNIFNMIPAFRFLNLPEAVWELESIIKEEVDYRFEVSNLKRLRKNLKKHKVYIPKPYMQYCRNKIIVMEKIEGVLMSDYLVVDDIYPEETRAWEKENNINPKKIARRLLFTFFRQLIEENLFHGDLHPGNIFILRNNRLALIDFGSIGTMDLKLRSKYIEFLKALSTKDFETVSDMILSFPSKLPVIDLNGPREEITRKAREWEMKTHIKSLPYHEKSLNAFSDEAIIIASKYKVPNNWAILRVGRSFSTLDASLNDLDPEFNYQKTMKRYYKGRNRRMRKKSMDPKIIQNLMSELPEKVNQIQMLIEPHLRRSMFAFEGYTHKIDHLISRLLQDVFFVFLGISVFFIINFLFIVYPGVTRTLGINHILENLPLLANTNVFLFTTVQTYFGSYSGIAWHVFAFADIYILYAMMRAVFHLREKDVNLPNTSTSTRK